MGEEEAEDWLSHEDCDPRPAWRQQCCIQPQIRNEFGPKKTRSMLVRPTASGYDAEYVARAARELGAQLPIFTTDTCTPTAFPATTTTRAASSSPMTRLRNRVDD